MLSFFCEVRKSPKEFHVAKNSLGLLRCHDEILDVTNQLVFFFNHLVVPNGFEFPSRPGVMYQLTHCSDVHPEKKNTENWFHPHIDIHPKLA